MSESSTFLLGHARSPHWDKATEQCLQQIGHVPPQANIGFLYVTDPFADLIQVIVEQLREETGVPHWVGTVGVGSCPTGQESPQTSAMAAPLGLLPDARVHTPPFQ